LYIQFASKKPPQVLEWTRENGRVYDKCTSGGSFLSIDPVTTDANTGGSFNRYAYAENNPYKYIDPDGRDAKEPSDPCAGQSRMNCGTLGTITVASDPGTTKNGRVGATTSTQSAFDPYAVLDTAANFSGGMGDTLSFGLTSYVRDEFSIGSVDQSATSYHVGEGAGVVVSTALGGAAGARAAGAKGAGLEFSHWIPKRLGGGNSILNGNYVSIVKHALSDPFRYRFMPRAWKAANPMPSIVLQQLNRIPYFWIGTAAGAGAGAASVGSH
ncbi:RHS repeat-associated core domain-containing protein, partial [Massilia sp. TWP1-3-3]|uniref:RHS repeat-associated core domain-containing protein n=1 Tax=Massilia sp. TWP1-3-3 TaxID=2804573 RepID=UPI003CF45CE6